MINIFLITTIYHSVALEIQYQKQCSCPNFLSQEQCVALPLLCRWKINEDEDNIEALPYVCVDNSCENAKTREDCDLVFPKKYQCAWKQVEVEQKIVEQCKPFTHCSDYIVPDPTYCNSKGDCTFGQLVGPGQYQCVQQQVEELQTVICATITKQDKCDGYQQAQDIYCTWVETQCQSKHITSCGDANETNMELCTGFPCQWDDENSQCKGIECSDMLVETDCTVVFPFDYSSLTICTWNQIEAVCEELQVAQLDSETCLKDTLYVYNWDDETNKCLPCIGIVLSCLSLILLYQ